MNYGRIAPFYQLLSQIIFGKSLIHAQQKVLASIPPKNRLLILGGGDGEIFKNLKNFPDSIDFVEVSSKMINLAKTKTTFPVNWIHENTFRFQPNGTYDYIYLPFLLDNFTPEQAGTLISSFKNWSSQNGIVIITDYPEKPAEWQKVLLKTMYLFFKIVSGLKVNQMPPVSGLMQSEGWKRVATQTSFSGFIETKTYIL